MWIRRLALGWPLAVSQENRLSYCIGSPVCARRLFIFFRTSQLKWSFLCGGHSLFGESLPWSGVLKSKRDCSKVDVKTYCISQLIRKIEQHQTSPQRDIFLHALIWKNKETFNLSKLRDGAEMADSWGTERAGETNVPRTLAHWLNTRPPESSHWSVVS